ncbi:xylulokinase [Microcella pacifica]|uniref:xylulokinase n=1 Tax=Microcella pacifica TaxID=2591847 RepID=UPI003314FEE3
MSGLTHYLGIDVGTTATKATLVRSDGEVLGRSRVKHIARPSEPGRVDPSIWWTSVMGACAALQPLSVQPSAIGLSVHCPVLIPLSETGEPVAMGYRFETPGLAEIVAAIGARSGAGRDDNLTGNRLASATAIMASHQLISSEAFRRARWLGSIGTFLGMRLTGRAAIDGSQASYTGIFDVVGRSGWSEARAQKFEVPIDLLPPLLGASEVLGALTSEAAAALGLDAGTPVAVGGGDTAAAALAAGLDGRSNTLLTLGTTHVVTRRAGSPVLDNRLLLQRTHVDDASWLLHGATNGGLALSVGANLIGLEVGELIRMATELSWRDRVEAPVFVPHVIAERGPFWQDSPLSGLIGLTSETDKHAAAWAVLEGVFFADRVVLEVVADPEPEKAIILNVDLASSSSLAQVASDVLGVPLAVCSESHLSARGASVLAARSAGCDLPPTSPDVTYTPDDDAAQVVEGRRERFLRARTALLQMTGVTSSVS